MCKFIYCYLQQVGEVQETHGGLLILFSFKQPSQIGYFEAFFLLALANLALECFSLVLFFPSMISSLPSCHFYMYSFKQWNAWQIGLTVCIDHMEWWTWLLQVYLLSQMKLVVGLGGTKVLIRNTFIRLTGKSEIDYPEEGWMHIICQQALPDF